MRARRKLLALSAVALVAVLLAACAGEARVFCDGSATAKVVVGGTSSTVKGGSCDEQGGYFAINFGAVTGPDFKGDRPDYIGALFPDGGGAPDAVTIRAGGAGGVLNHVT